MASSRGNSPERAFLVHEVESVEIEGPKKRAEISFRKNGTSGQDLIKKISRFIAGEKTASGQGLERACCFPRRPAEVRSATPFVSADRARSFPLGR